MSTWFKKINIKQFLTGDDSPEEAVRVAAKVAAYIRKHVPEYYAVGEFESVVSEPEKWRNTAFNTALRNFYDFADEERIWCG